MHIHKTRGGVGRHTCYGGSGPRYAGTPLRDGRVEAENVENGVIIVAKGENVVTNNEGGCDCRYRGIYQGGDRLGVNSTKRML